MRQTITDKQNRAKCMAWRNGKRCNRKAATVVFYRKPTQIEGHQARCAECAQADDVRRVEQTCERGFTVHASPLDPIHQRHYQEIPRIESDDRLDELWEAKFRAYERDGM